MNSVDLNVFDCQQRESTFIQLTAVKSFKRDVLQRLDLVECHQHENPIVFMCLRVTFGIQLHTFDDEEDHSKN